MKITLEQKIVFSKTASRQIKSLKLVFKELLSIHQDYIDSQEGALVWIGVPSGQKAFGNDFVHPGLLLVVKELK